MRSTIYPNDHGSQASPLAGALAGVAMAGYLLPALAFYSQTLRGALGVEAETATGEGAALTFDDGPHAQGTPAVLDVLAERGTRATFFLVGEQVLRNPALGAEIVAGGHSIGLHCHRHRNLLRLAPWQVREDVSRAQAAIEDATGVSPALYRPPYGILNASALRLARRAGRRTLLWSHWGCDWQARATPESIATRVTAGVGEGSILLLHDADDYSAKGSWQRTALALPRVLDALAERGIEAVLP
ncbi:MAG TPA: polysaccharide deacetylase family protein [Solirubrobacteraceae bacterium]|jgi:peptidoglycan/xylan/chitin deacetylase (PgdA/CDA1 family)|nr:polysaccharide deacetylase family protein [Solirubrobacteraceae bacterium]